ncbi:MAG: DUF4238 domain-containing protein [Neptuniibacter sp.]
MDEFRANNHYVPKLYLKQWEDSSNKICVYKTLVSHENEQMWQTRSASKIAYQRHLYTQLVSGQESDEFERWIDCEYESPARAVIKKATTDKRLSKEDWRVLIRFLACQDVRTPARLLEHLNRADNEYQKVLDDSVQRFVSEMENNPVTNKVPSDRSNDSDQTYPLKIITKRDPNDSEMGILRVESYIGRTTWIRSMKTLLTHTEKVLQQHKWSIIKPAKGYYWPTSDNPVIKLNYTDDKNYDFGGGWGRHKGNILFPLGPQHAMFVQIGDRPILKGTRLNESLTIQLKNFIIQHAHRMVFSNNCDEDIASIRPRIINPQAVNNERKQLKEWHKQNIKLESEYL